MHIGALAYRHPQALSNAVTFGKNNTPSPQGGGPTNGQQSTPTGETSILQKLQQAAEAVAGGVLNLTGVEDVIALGDYGHTKKGFRS
jgi:hypothetical protein